jgi:hypothetical protein
MFANCVKAIAENRSAMLRVSATVFLFLGGKVISLFNNGLFLG